MNAMEQLVKSANDALADLRAGKIDATTAQAHASLIKAQCKVIDTEVAMARTGQLVDVAKPAWQRRLRDYDTPAAT